MRTNIDIDDSLLEEAAKLTGIKQKKQLVNEALRILIQAKKRRPISELVGHVQLDPKYDYKKARSR